jgi:hypothetical protein
VTLLSLGLTGVVLMTGIAAAATLLLRGIDGGLRLFDDERRSPLYCAAPPDHLPSSGPPVLRVPSADPTPSPVPCLPPRLDYAAPGHPREAPPEALCAVLRYAGLPLTLTGGRPCT